MSLNAYSIDLFVFFVCQQKAAYEIDACVVGWVMFIRGSEGGGGVVEGVVEGVAEE